MSDSEKSGEKICFCAAISSAFEGRGFSEGGNDAADEVFNRWRGKLDATCASRYQSICLRRGADLGSGNLKNSMPETSLSDVSRNKNFSNRNEEKRIAARMVNDCLRDLPADSAID